MLIYLKIQGGYDSAAPLVDELAGQLCPKFANSTKTSLVCVNKFFMQEAIMVRSELRYFIGLEFYFLWVYLTDAFSFLFLYFGIGAVMGYLMQVIEGAEVVVIKIISLVCVVMLMLLDIMLFQPHRGWHYLLGDMLSIISGVAAYFYGKISFALAKGKFKKYSSFGGAFLLTNSFCGHNSAVRK